MSALSSPNVRAATASKRRHDLSASNDLLDVRDQLR
jgi:hypothetical protein